MCKPPVFLFKIQFPCLIWWRAFFAVQLDFGPPKWLRWKPGRGGQIVAVKDSKKKELWQFCDGETNSWWHGALNSYSSGNRELQSDLSCLSKILHFCFFLTNRCYPYSSSHIVLFCLSYRTKVLFVCDFESVLDFAGFTDFHASVNAHEYEANLWFKGELCKSCRFFAIFLTPAPQSCGFIFNKADEKIIHGAGSRVLQGTQSLALNKANKPFSLRCIYLLLKVQRGLTNHETDTLSRERKCGRKDETGRCEKKLDNRHSSNQNLWGFCPLKLRCFCLKCLTVTLP